MAKGVLDGGTLIAAMNHAVGTLLVVAGAVFVPLGGFHQFLEGFDVALAQQIAGPLPAEHVARRVAPRRAVIALIAGQEVEEEGRLREFPLALLGIAEDRAEQLLGLAAVEEMRLVGRAVISIAGRYGYALGPAAA